MIKFLKYALTIMLLYNNGVTKCQVISNIVIKPVQDAIEISYDLEGPNEMLVDVHLKIVEREGMKEIYPKSISGNLKWVTPGKHKIITWQILRDQSYMDSEIKAVLIIENINYTSHTSTKNKTIGGPANALLSMLLPGLGDVFVNGYETPVIKPGYITLIFLGSAGLAWYCAEEAENYNEAASQSIQQYEIDEFHKQAEYYSDNAKFMTGIAATVWALDVIRVAAKGFSNKNSFMSSNENARISFTAGITNVSLKYKF